MIEPPELWLPNRQGKLPADIAYLLAKYPREEWHEHINYGGAARMWIERHNFFRELGGILQQSTHAFREDPRDIPQFQRFFGSRLNLFLGHLEGHHNVEDYNYFPLFRAFDDKLVRGFDLLENDHEVIHELLVASNESGEAFYNAMAEAGDAQRFAADRYVDNQDRLIRWLLRHLEDEEDLLIPTILEHSDETLGLA